MKRFIWLTALVTVFLSGVAFGASYSSGFVWDWEADYSTSDATPSDAGSIGLPGNSGKSSGPPTEGVWSFFDIFTAVSGGWPGGSNQPSILLPDAQIAYWTSYGHGHWDNVGNHPAVGIDDGPDYNFFPEYQNRHFIFPGTPGPGVDRIGVALGFKCPQDGYYDVNVTYRNPSNTPLCPMGVRTQVVLNTMALTTYDALATNTDKNYTFDLIPMYGGDILYFGLGPGSALVPDGCNCDETVLTLSISYGASFPTPTPPPTNAATWELYE